MFTVDTQRRERRDQYVQPQVKLEAAALAVRQKHWICEVALDDAGVGLCIGQGPLEIRGGAQQVDPVALASFVLHSQAISQKQRPWESSCGGTERVGARA